MIKLRRNGIYTLPDGKAYALFGAGEGRFFLYTCKGGAANPPNYETTKDGRIVPWIGGGVEWKLTDLRDTGKTYNFAEDFDCPD